MQVRMEQAPKPDSRIMLSEEKDALGVPRTKEGAETIYGASLFGLGLGAVMILAGSTLFLLVD